MDKIKLARKIISRFYSEEGPERVGFLLENRVLEVPNYCPTPDAGFIISPEDVVNHGERAWATWHTHPGHPSNLSGDDFNMFREWEDHYHFIVGSDGVRCYKMDTSKGALMEIRDAL